MTPEKAIEYQILNYLTATWKVKGHFAKISNDEIKTHFATQKVAFIEMIETLE